MDKKLKPDYFWAINSKNYQTYMVSNTNTITFDCNDFYKYMEDYAQARIKDLLDRHELFTSHNMENFAAKCMLLNPNKTTDKLLEEFIKNDIP